MESEEQEKTGDRWSDNRQSIEGEINIKKRDADGVMDTGLTPSKPRSWKDCLMGKGLQINE
ncbi:hypothetical protein PVK06_039807 [Gossypium arboreum]|uniref:Uncharacterized protein n=1 Tax=Gossypium arboreum TaxID=29729 RepID=A0ABR0N435_GOSAR|nr:hypothetical protein PVK06_039807 [Gossypium arboreum]